MELHLGLCAHSVHVLLDNACKAASELSTKIEKEQRPTSSPGLNSCKYHAWGATHKAFWKLNPKPKSFWIESHTGLYGSVFRGFNWHSRPEL